MTRVRGIYRWTDCGYLRGWRIQAHYRDGSFRLLDPRGYVYCRGTEAYCQRELEQVGKQWELELPTGTVIVLLHGLARNAWAMSSMGAFLGKEIPNAEVVAYQYASTSGPVSLHSRRFIKFIEYAKHAEQVHFVGHSLGNILLRRAYRLAEEGHWNMPKLGRHVMLGPPNQGSQIADRLQSFVPVSWFTGAPFFQLGKDWKTFSSELTLPPCPYGIVAGNLPTISKVHPFLDGANDIIVRVEETRLEGASDFMQINVPHNWLMNSRRVQQATLNFLKSGKFKPCSHESLLQS